MKNVRSIITLLALLVAVSLSAQEATPVAEAASSEPTKPAAIPGFIFNASNLLLDLQPYQGGVGLKLLYPSHALRLSAGFEYTDSTGKLDTSAGFAYERPFYTGRVNPYWGASAVLGFSQERSETDEDNWSRTRVLDTKVGGLLGLEFLLTDYLSVFAEYELAGSLAWSNFTQSVSGTETENPSTLNFLVGTGLGNSASLGVVVYLKPSGRVPEKEPKKEK